MNKLYRFTHIAAYLAFIHGTGYGIIKYFFKLETEYGLRPHPHQDTWQALHILLSPLLIFAFGLLWKTHIVKKFKRSPNKRKTGISLVILMVLMIISGYLVQVIYNLEVKELSVWIHLIISGLFMFAYVCHHKLGRRDEKSSVARNI